MVLVYLEWAVAIGLSVLVTALLVVVAVKVVVVVVKVVVAAVVAAVAVVLAPDGTVFSAHCPYCNSLRPIRVGAGSAALVSSPSRAIGTLVVDAVQAAAVG